MSPTGYRRQTVPVRGGELTVGVWGDEGPLVVAAHGITSSHVAWTQIGEAIGQDHRLVALDLRGRGASRDLPPPYGMAAHAADVAAVIEAYGGGPATLLGHSMGGFVVLETARNYPLLVERMVLIDGGPLLPVPAGLDLNGDESQVAEAISAAVGPAYARLSKIFPTRDAYRDLWRAHPAFTEWTPVVEAYVDYDLVGAEPNLRPACLLEAALRDAQDLYALEGAKPTPVDVPTVFLRAQRGMFNEPTPFYAAGYASEWLPGVVERTVPDVNHYTIVLGSGAAVVAEAVRTGE